jgi:hypothetical protein
MSGMVGDILVAVDAGLLGGEQQALVGDQGVSVGKRDCDLAG